MNCICGNETKKDGVLYRCSHGDITIVYDKNNAIIDVIDHKKELIKSINDLITVYESFQLEPILADLYTQFLNSISLRDSKLNAHAIIDRLSRYLNALYVNICSINTQANKLKRWVDE